MMFSLALYFFVHLFGADLVDVAVPGFLAAAIAVAVLYRSPSFVRLGVAVALGVLGGLMVFILLQPNLPALFRVSEFGMPWDFDLAFVASLCGSFAGVLTTRVSTNSASEN